MRQCKAKQRKYWKASDFPGGGIESTVVEMLQELLTQPKVIRHIQRGKFTENSTDVKQSSISLVGFSNADKMIAIVTGYGRNSETVDVKELTASILVVGCIYNSSAYFGGSYQVIEFC